MNKQDLKFIIVVMCFTWFGISVGYYFTKFHTEPQTNTIYVDKIIYKVIPKDTVQVRITGYHANFEECGNNLGMTFDGSKIPDNYKDVPVKWCAVSQDLLYYHFDLGDTIEVLAPGLEGKFIIHDKTSNKLKNTVDILLPDGVQAFLLKGIAF